MEAKSGVEMVMGIGSARGGGSSVLTGSGVGSSCSATGGGAGSSTTGGGAGSIAGGSDGFSSAGALAAFSSPNENGGGGGGGALATSASLAGPGAPGLSPRYLATALMSDSEVKGLLSEPITFGSSAGSAFRSLPKPDM